MARLFPRIDPEDIENPGERSVAKALLEQLPRRVEVFHSFNWLAKTASGKFEEGECDFILIEPESGLLFVEVKGGSLVFDGTRWIRHRGRHRRELNKDPFAQAQTAMHEIVNIVNGRHAGGLPFTFGFAVAFPDSKFEGQVPASVQRELILDADRLRTVSKAIQTVFRRSPGGTTARCTLPRSSPSVRRCIRNTSLCRCSGGRSKIRKSACKG